MNPLSPSYTLPLTFASLGSGHDLEWSCSNSRSTVLISLQHNTDDEYQPRVCAILGCDDGTVYAFRNSPAYATDPITHPNTDPPTLPTRLSPAATQSSRSASPTTSGRVPFNVSSRSRIVSGITPAQVEAPKNYVDYDDEPEKLKGILKGRTYKDKDKERRSPPLSSDSSSVPASPRHQSKRSDPLAPRSLLSATNSPSQSPRSLSRPTSPTVPSVFHEHVHDWELLYHIVPSTPPSPVVSILLLEDETLFAVLHRSGQLAVYSTADGSCMTSLEVESVSTRDGAESGSLRHDVWIWRQLELAFISQVKYLCLVTGETDSAKQTAVLLLTASIDPACPTSALDPTDNGVQEKSRVAVIQFRAGSHRGPYEVAFELLGAWSFDGFADSAGIYRHHSENILYLITPGGSFSLQTLDIRPDTPSSDLPKHGQSNGATNLAAVFKAINLKVRSAEQLPLDAESAKQEPVHTVAGRMVIGEPLLIGQVLKDEVFAGMTCCITGGRFRSVVWTDQGLTVFEYSGTGTDFGVISHAALPNIRKARLLSEDSLVVVCKDRIETYSLTKGSIQPESKQVLAGDYEAVHIASLHDVYATTVQNRSRLLQAFKPEAASVMWRARPYAQQSAARCTCIMPLDFDCVLLGYGDGHLKRFTLAALCGESVPVPQNVSSPQIPASVVKLHMVQNVRTREQFVVGGGDDGSVAIWTSQGLVLCAYWVIFTAPLACIIPVPAEEQGPLRGCILCISRDGTIAVIAVDGFHYLYLIPGSPFALDQTKEFWRSMSSEKAVEMTSQGGWTELSLKDRPSGPILRSLAGDAAICGSTLLVDLEQFVGVASTTARLISSGRDQTRAVYVALAQVKLLLSTLLTLRLNNDIDVLCKDRLGIPLSHAHAGFSSNGTNCLFNGSQAWVVSGEISAARALSIVVLLRTLALFDELADSASTVMAFYMTSLSGVVGPHYKAPSLVYLARRWFDSSNELRQAARLLLDASIARLGDDEASSIVDHWQHYRKSTDWLHPISCSCFDKSVPCLQPAADRETLAAALALFLCGFIASDKYSLIAVSALTDISKSIALYLHDEQSLYRVLAIELCSRGFHIWQHYIDAMEMLRALFMLATNSRKEAITAQNAGPQARLAVLHIASNETALFMTTLSLDILNPVDLDHRRSVMQIVAFLIRKRPLVLYANLPRLMEAVVKSLDPNSTTNRDAVLDAATEIIGHVVKTFRSVDFHMGSQRLAVGTSEGALVMYDLKTAIRLYILEGHKKRVTACSFSPDGRRLVTLSLEESVVLVWKVGTSFASFFNPGAPPRQGHAGSEPFKTLSFAVGEAGNMDVAESLDAVRFEWPSDRSVRLRIRESVLTFST
ncbi:unnamed protein product [Mycena citricolor]|uniref:WD40 repeat-like protein n=1 Tax=Mycena citricolor TaxID=2018698 RepID=A0AAD2Q810_9AGAR|nr:unnamed protein product [Mycena citricolor]